MIATLAMALLLQGGATDRASQVTVRVTPESPALGEPIDVEVRVRTPRGADVRFPTLLDSLQRLEALDPRVERDASTSGMVDRTAIYRMIAFDTGQAAARVPDITLLREGVETRVRATPVSLRIRSVLPADSSGRVPRPPRPILEGSSFWWKWWLASAVVAVLAVWALLRWRAYRRENRVIEPLAVARAEFAHTASLGLLDAGEPGRHAIAHVEAMRRYIAARYPALSTSKTGREIAALAEGADLPIMPHRLAELFDRIEAVSFARANIAREDAEALAKDARRIVEDMDTALKAREVRAARSVRRRVHV